MQTQIIRYNLKERGRKHRGVERNFNIPKIVAAINSPACQERVQNRDMVGFYGHWPRVKFGMNPAEGGIADGKAQAVEPALVTTHLVAHSDGTIEHKAEFLPTQSGDLAYKLFNARTGGFSSAIDTVKPEFFGFDFVIEPNYSTNRGYSLDSVLCDGGLCGLSCCDVDAAILEEQQAGMMAFLDSVTHGYDATLAVLDALKRENAALKKTLNRKTAAEVIRNRIKPSIQRAERMTLDAAEFKAARLPLPGELEAVIQKVSDEELAYQRMVSRLSGGRHNV